MAWVRMDDKFPRGRKVKRATRVLGGGKRARARILAVWCDAMAYCNLNLTDGLYPFDEMDELPDAHPDEVFDAMAVGDEELGPMVERAATGWQFRNYADYQPTKAEVEAKLARDRERKRVRKDSARNPDGRNADSERTEPNRPDPDRTEPSRPEPPRTDRPQADGQPTRDWYRECQELHAGQCGGQFKHDQQRRLDQVRARRMAKASA